MGDRVQPALHRHARTAPSSDQLTIAAPQHDRGLPVDDRDATLGTHPCPNTPPRIDHASPTRRSSIGGSRLSHTAASLAVSGVRM
jgi:hypothetical protein